MKASQETPLSEKNALSPRHRFRVLRYLCKTCSQCIIICPVEAISYENDNSAFIDQNICISCGACIQTCPAYAIRSN